MGRSGFTLIELLLVVAIMGIASLYMFGSVVTTNRTYVVVDQVTESQQGMRALGQLLRRDVRHAGFMIPLAAAVCAEDNQGSPDVFYASDAEAIQPDDDFQPYEGARVQGGATNVNGAGATTVLTLDSLQVEPSPPVRLAYDTDADGANDSDFQVGGGAIVVDLNDVDRGAACGTVEAVDPAGPSVTVRTVSAALGASAGGERLVVIPAHEYRIVNGDQIHRNGLLLAQGVEDLQIALFLDANGDNVVDAGEMHGTGSGANANFDAQDTDLGDMREVRFNLMVRTRSEDRDFTGQAQTLENRPAGGNDGYRRRVQTITVRPRNMTRTLGS